MTPLKPAQHCEHATPLGTWTVDLRKGRCFLDSALAQLFGFSEQEGKEGVSASQLLSSVALPDREPMLAQWLAVRETGGVFNSRYRVRTPEGPFVPVQSIGMCHCDDSGEPYLFSGQITALQSFDDKPSALVVDYMIKQTLDLARAPGDEMLVYLLEMAAAENETKLMPSDQQAAHAS